VQANCRSKEDAALVAKLRKIADKFRKRPIADAVHYALASGVRADILCYLNEAARSPSELASLLGMKLSTLEHHIKELLASGSIELVDVKEGAGNTKEHFYRAVELPYFTEEEMWAMPFEARQEIYGLILQSGAAEALAAFRAGKVSSDPRVCMAWAWFNLDDQGRRDLAAENVRYWNRLGEIEGASANRMAISGKAGASIVVSLFAHERVRFLNARPARGQVRLAGDGPSAMEKPDDREIPGDG
jgi:DNA-binding transcriptional ArsR family regulator